MHAGWPGRPGSLTTQKESSPLRRTPKRRATGCPIPDGFLPPQLEGNQQADYHCEQTQTFDKGSYNQHGSLDTARSLGLTANGFHSAATDAANTQAYAQSYQTCTDTCAHYGQTSRIRNLSNSLQQQREKHKKKEKWEKRKKRKESGPRTARPVLSRRKN